MSLAESGTSKDTTLWTRGWVRNELPNYSVPGRPNVSCSSIDNEKTKENVHHNPNSILLTASLTLRTARSTKLLGLDISPPLFSHEFRQYFLLLLYFFSPSFVILHHHISAHYFRNPSPPFPPDYIYPKRPNFKVSGPLAALYNTQGTLPSSAPKSEQALWEMIIYIRSLKHIESSVGISRTLF
ncbi:hypothetical protein PMG11_05899 [Penicillium brasilianum]|uniref:Uncharacterized protein n=1 Tax=Penicillium brasilianum TaxID=104259 RepID=A0A0F7TQD1_PENBI|nr:hypothetical protein PMG11_05899 [Penicillium brasilianum]